MSKGQQLLGQIDQATKERLDSLVYECKENEATEINNKGNVAQVNYLLSQGFTLKMIQEEVDHG